MQQYISLYFMCVPILIVCILLYKNILVLVLFIFLKKKEQILTIYHST